MLKSGDRISVAIQNALVSLAAYLVGYYFTASFHGRSSSIGGLWSLVSGIVVLQATSRDTWKSAVLRVLISSGNSELSPFANAALRFIESVIGAGTAVLAVLLWPKPEEAT